MHVAIYKGRRRPDTYLFVTGGEALAGLPDDFRRALGELEHVMDLVLTPDRRLARVEARTVLRALLQRGCYIQLPPRDEAKKTLNTARAWPILAAGPPGAARLPRRGASAHEPVSSP